MKDNYKRPSRTSDYNERESGPSAEAVSLTKKEQDNRHKIQGRYLTTYRIGQFFGFIYNLALLYLVYDLIKNGEKTLALQIFALNTAIIAFVILTFLIERKLFSRRMDHKRNNRRPDHRNRKPMRQN